MSDSEIKSKAFTLAALKSESYRVVGLLCLLGFLLVFVVARGLTSGFTKLVIAQLFVLFIVIAHEAFVLRAIRRALANETEVGPGKRAINVLIESQIPTVAAVLLIATPWMTASQVLVAPVVLIYFLLIILSTLRLNPGLSLLTGLLSALGYLFVIFATEIRFKNPELPLALYFIYASLIFVAGILAAFVASQIRVHVTAALKDAKLKSELAQINHDLDIARSIQQGLFPTRAPELKDLDLAGWNQSANQTGGDYFDWQPLPDGRLAISLGDATGHGIGPALVSTSCRAYARASFVVNGNHDQILERLNRLLADDLSANRFVTFAVVFLDPKTSEVEVLSAGHGPILLYQHDKDKFESLDAQGIPLGMIAGVGYEKAITKSLEPGDMIVLVTDGFYEWENPDGEEFGLVRLEQTLREARDSSAEDVIKRLRSAVEVFCKGTEQKDDLTAVVLKRKTT